MRRTLNPNTAAIGAAVLGAVLIALLFFREQVGHRLFPCCEIRRERNLLFAPFFGATQLLLNRYLITT